MRSLYSVSPRYWYFAGPLIGSLSTLLGMWVAVKNINAGNSMPAAWGVLASVLCAVVALILSTLGVMIYIAFSRRQGKL